MRLFILALVASLIGCTRGTASISEQLAVQVQNSATERIDLAAFGPPSWERVCVLTPYTANAQVEQVLGFKWDATGNTSISSSDGINVLVFVRGAEVVAFAEHPRNRGDLAQLSPRCLPRARATVVRRTEPSGWVILVSKSAA